VIIILLLFEGPLKFLFLDLFREQDREKERRGERERERERGRERIRQFDVRERKILI